MTLTLPKPKVLVIALLSVVFTAFVLVGHTRYRSNVSVLDNSLSNFLDGCYHVYLDVGSNVGIQVRKLYEPNYFPNAKVLAVFDKYFGPIESRNLNQICAVGFEPNPAHAARLNQTEQAYVECGWPVKFFTLTAVGAENRDSVDFFTDDDQGNREWGASVLGSNNNLAKKAGVVRMMRLSDFVNKVVATRFIPSQHSDSSLPPAVVMKMDIEGSELETMADMLYTGAASNIDVAMIEYHERLTNDANRKKQFIKLKQGLEVVNTLTSGGLGLSEVDDESYGGSNFPLPQCKSNLPAS